MTAGLGAIGPRPFFFFRAGAVSRHEVATPGASQYVERVAAVRVRAIRHGFP
jgi:hypothetical protein